MEYSFPYFSSLLVNELGLVVGVVAGGNGIGAYLFGLLAMSIYNPTNENTGAFIVFFNL